MHNAHLLVYEIASLLIHYHAQVPIQRKLTFICSSDYRVVSGRAQLCRAKKSVNAGQMRPENICITLTVTSTYYHSFCNSGEGKTNGLEQALPSVTYYLPFCYSAGLAHSLYTAMVDSGFSYTPIRFREPEACCTYA